MAGATYFFTGSFAQRSSYLAIFHRNILNASKSQRHSNFANGTTGNLCYKYWRRRTVILLLKADDLQH